MKTLHLVLMGRWYDKIEQGEKTSEYRKCTPYWDRRFEHNKYDRVVFHRGYTNRTMTFEIKSIAITHAKNDLNELYCWEIKLGKQIPRQEQGQ